jgi:hypothetical protein
MARPGAKVHANAPAKRAELAAAGGTRPGQHRKSFNKKHDLPGLDRGGRRRIADRQELGRSRRSAFLGRIAAAEEARRRLAEPARHRRSSATARRSTGTMYEPAAGNFRHCVGGW